MGETFHRNNPSPLTERLYLAAAKAVSGRVLLDLGITCLINATLELPTLAYHMTDCLQIAVEDRVGSKLYVYFDLVADKINSIHQSDGGKIMIYCRAGMSRSATLCIAYFIKYHSMSAEDAFAYVKNRRPIIHPNVGFMRQLREYERKLKGHKHRLVEATGAQSMLPPIRFACAAHMDAKLVDFDAVTAARPQPKTLLVQARRPRVNVSNDACDQCAEIWTPLCLAETSSLSHRALQQRSVSVLVVEAASSDADCAVGVAVASSHAPTLLHCLAHPAHLTPDGRKSPFSRLTEPARIAVSFVVVPAAECTPLADAACLQVSNRQQRNNATSAFSVPAELHPLPENAQALHLECVGHIPQTVSSANVEAAQAVFSHLFISAVETRTQPLEAAVVLAQQKVHPETLTRPGAARPQALPAAKRPVLQRSCSIRLPGLRMSALPEEQKTKRQEAAANYLAAITISLPPMTLHRVQEMPDFSDLSRDHKRKLAVLLEEALPCPESDSACLLDMEMEGCCLNVIEGDSGCRATAAPLSCLPAATSAAFPETVMETDWREDLESLPMREYAYYVPVKRSEVEAELHRPSEQAALQSCWFYSLTQRRPTRAVCLHSPLASPASFRHAPETPPSPNWLKAESVALNWAAERYYIDLSATLRSCRPMQDWAHAQAEVAHCEGSTQLSVCSVADQTHFATEALAGVRKQDVATYQAWDVTYMCMYPLAELAVTQTALALERPNLFSEPTTFPSHCRVNVCDLSDAAALVSSCELADVRDELSELVGIPDVVGDVAQLRDLIMLERDPRRVAIWLDVFKRSVIRSRPIYPFVSVQELLCVPTRTQWIEYQNAEEFVDSTDYAAGPQVARPKIEEPLFVPEIDSDCILNGTETVDYALSFEECDFASIDQEAYAVSFHHVEQVKDMVLEMASSMNANSIFVTTCCVTFMENMRAIADITVPMGSCGISDIASVSDLARTAATVPLAVQGPVEVTFGQALLCVATCPVSHFLQDLEELASMLTHEFLAEGALATETSPADVFWYFELSNDATAVQQPHIQLFVPDPETVGRAASDDPPEGSLVREAYEARAPPPLSRRESMRVRTQDQRGLMREVHPRARSISRFRDPVLDDLRDSMRQANDLLDRRRAAAAAINTPSASSSLSSSRWTGPSPISSSSAYVAERERRRRAAQCAATDHELNSLRGIIDTAQRWLWNHKTPAAATGRRDRSRARDTLKY